MVKASLEIQNDIRDLYVSFMAVIDTKGSTVQTCKHRDYARHAFDSSVLSHHPDSFTQSSHSPLTV